VQGERPWSWIKITIAVVIAIIVIGGGLYVYDLVESGGAAFK
jgi:hypothetical protein